MSRAAARASLPDLRGPLQESRGPLPEQRAAFQDPWLEQVAPERGNPGESVDAARDAGRKIDDLVVRRDDDDVVLQRDGIGGLVLNEAIAKWWGGLFGWHRIPFVMQHQQQTQWCWAAVSVSVSHYYSPWSGWTQCAMVNAELVRLGLPPIKPSTDTPAAPIS